MEDAYIIHGGKPIKGEVAVSGAKNLALKAIIAALLFDTKVILKNVPRINDVLELIHLIGGLGGKIKFLEENTVEISSNGIKRNKVDLLHGSKTRVSFLLFAPLLHRFKKCFIPNPGGCRIGVRPIDRSIEGMKALGIEIVYNHNSGYYEAKMNDFPKGEYTFFKSTHTGTELLIMLSVLSRSRIVIRNAAFEPEIDELIRFLNQGGAKIRRANGTVTIDGVRKLKQENPFRIIADRNEAVTFASLAIASKGEVLLKQISPPLLGVFIDTIKKTGSKIEVAPRGKLRFAHNGGIKPVSVETAPHPGFMTDWQPNWTILMTQARGASIVHERVFSNRFSYVNELRKLGAKIEFIEPEISNPKEFYFFNYRRGRNYKQAVKVYGPRRLHNGVITVSDLRAGASLAIASLIATGESVVQGASILERGYEKFVEKISLLGGQIKRV